MGYLALYRRFRPKDYDELHGQDHIITTLRNQVRADRLSHAYLFCGTRGTGKTSVARILTKAVNCEKPQDDNPCGECEICREMSTGASMDVFEIDAASNSKVEMVRTVINKVRYSPNKGKKKVYIIDGIHMLKQEAWIVEGKTIKIKPDAICAGCQM